MFKAGRSEPISVNGTHNDPIEREIVSLVSWYRIKKSWKEVERDSSFFYSRVTFRADSEKEEAHGAVAATSSASSVVAA